MAYNRQIKEVSKDRQIHFVDMFTEFGHDSSLFIDQFHYTPQGIDRFSKILKRRVEPIVDAYARDMLSHSDKEDTALNPQNETD